MKVYCRFELMRSSLLSSLPPRSELQVMFFFDHTAHVVSLEELFTRLEVDPECVRTCVMFYYRCSAYCLCVCVCVCVCVYVCVFTGPKMFSGSTDYTAMSNALLKN